jgi:hypothetical protein
MDVEVNGEDLSYRMRAIAEDGNVFDFHIEAANRFDLVEDVDNISNRQNHWYVEPYQVSEIMSVAGVHDNQSPFISLAEMVKSFNHMSGYNFTKGVVVEHTKEKV